MKYILIAILLIVLAVFIISPKLRNALFNSKRKKEENKTDIETPEAVSLTLNMETPEEETRYTQEYIDYLNTQKISCILEEEVPEEETRYTEEYIDFLKKQNDINSNETTDF